MGYRKLEPKTKVERDRDNLEMANDLQSAAAEIYEDFRLTAYATLNRVLARLKKELRRDGKLGDD